MAANRLLTACPNRAGCDTRTIECSFLNANEVYIRLFCNRLGKERHGELAASVFLCGIIVSVFSVDRFFITKSEKEGERGAGAASCEIRGTKAG